MAKYKVGMVVKYNPKWCRAEERELTHVIMEVHDYSDDRDIGKVRYLIKSTKPTQSGFFYPTEEVDEEMIEPIGKEIKS